MGVRKAFRNIRRSLSSKSDSSVSSKSKSARGEDGELQEVFSPWQESSDILALLFGHAYFDFSALSTARQVCKAWKAIIDASCLLARKSEIASKMKLPARVLRSDRFSRVQAFIHLKGEDGGAAGCHVIGFADGTVGFCRTSETRWQYFCRVHPTAIGLLKVVDGGKAKVRVESVTARYYKKPLKYMM